MDAADEGKALEHTEAIDRATECLRYLHGTLPANAIQDFLNPIFLNTSARSRAYLEYDAQLGGHTFPLPITDRASACDTNVTAQLGGVQ